MGDEADGGVESRVLAPTTGYQPNLDGLRAIAVGSVVVFHIGNNVLAGGWMGVDLFFALSGYLITSLLILEVQTHRSIALRHFWARRSLRLLPALLLALGAFSAYALLGGHITNGHGDTLTPLVSMGWVGSSLVYITNWFQAFRLDPPIELGHLWSLAVEEQFYIVWPVTLLALWSRSRNRSNPARTVFVVAVAGVSFSVALTFVILALRGWNESSWAFIYYGTPTRIGGMLAGAALAAWWAMHPPTPGWSQRGKGRWCCRVSTALLVLLLLTCHVEYFSYLLPLILIVSTVTVAGAVDARHRIAALLQLSVMRWVGRRSYGIYLWHQIYLGLVAAWVRPVAVLTALAATLVTAELSFRFVETPVLRLRSRFARL